MNDLVLNIPNKKAHIGGNMDFSQMIANYAPATAEQLTYSGKHNLSYLLQAGKLIYIDSPISVDGEFVQAQGSIGLVLDNSHGHASNLLLYPPQGKPYLLQSFADDGLVIGEGEYIAVESIDIALQLASREHDYTIIAPPESYPRQYENLVKAFAKDRQITVFCNGSNSKDYAKTYDGHNVRLAVITDSLLNAIDDSGSLADVLADELTIIQELGAFKWGKPNLIRHSLPAVKSITPDMLPKPLYDYVTDNANRLSVPPEFIAIPLIVALGSVIGTKASILPKKYDDWEIIPNLWGGIVGRPSSKKSPSLAVALKPLDNLTFKAKQAYEQAQKSYASQTLINKERDKANGESLKELVKKQAKQKPDSKDKITDEQIQALADSIANPDNEGAGLPILKRYVTDDSTYEKLGELESQNPNGILVKRDELTGLLSTLDKEDNQQARAFYLEGYNGTGSYTFDRMMRGTAFVENHCLSVIGGIQPDKLEMYLSHIIKGLNNDGLMQRFSLMVYPDPLPNAKEKDLPVNKEIRDEVYRIFETIDQMTIGHFIKYGANPPDDFIKRPHFRLSDKAYPVFMKWYDDLKDKANNAEHGIISEHLVKYANTIPSLALIFHLVDCVESNQSLGAVSLPALQGAIKWGEMLETHMTRIYSTVTDNAYIKASLLSAKILDMYRNTTDKTDKTPHDWLKEGFNARQVLRKCWKGLTDSKDIQTAIDILIENNWLRWESVPSTGQGGRPTEHYFINPNVKAFIK